MFYGTRVMAVPCWKGTTGYQAELIKSPQGDVISGNIWSTKEAALEDAARLLAAAEGLFENN